MLVVPFDHASPQHLGDARHLLKARDMSSDLIDDLPGCGLIAYDKGKPVALGFVRRIEGTYVMLDSYITDPGIESSIRNRALDHITHKLIQWAHSHGVTKVLAFSTDENTISRAYRHGFGYLPHVFTALNLS